MPVKSNIELSEGRLYISGMEDSIEVHGGELEYTEEEFYDESEPYIKMSQEPLTLSFDNAEFARDWTLVKCDECGYEFPVTEFYVLTCGTKGWKCPSCVYNKLIEEARKRGNLNGP